MSDRADTPLSFKQKLHRRYGLYTVGVVLFIGVLGVLENTGWPRSCRT